MLTQRTDILDDNPRSFEVAELKCQVYHLAAVTLASCLTSLILGFLTCETGHNTSTS